MTGMHAEDSADVCTCGCMSGQGRTVLMRIMLPGYPLAVSEFVAPVRACARACVCVQASK